MDNNLLLFLVNDHPLDFNVVGEIVNNLAEPLENDIGEQRRVVPKNENFYEVTIPLYMGDLFREHFRMCREACDELVQVIAAAAPDIAVRSKIPVEKKIMFTLWVVSKQETFLAAGDQFGLARSTAHEVFREIITVISALMQQYVRWPVEYHAIVEDFRNHYHYPGIVGAIDGSHIEIKQPTHNANDYYNRNNYHSIIVQGICDNSMKFLDVFIGIPGRVHDARVFRNSTIFERIHNMPPDFHVIGDSAYPLTVNVMAPFKDNGHLNEMEVNFNIVHSQARAVIERAFGRLKGKFRRLKYLDIASPDFGSEIISAACMLHNFIIMHDGVNDEHFEPDIGIVNEYFGDDEVNMNVAVQKRYGIAEYLM